MKRLALLTLLVALAAARPALGAPCAETADCLAAIEKAQQHTETLQADFEQEKHLALLEQPLVSRGRFLFKRPDRVRLEVREPQAATLVIRGSEVHIPGISSEDAKALSMTPTAAMFSRLGALFTGAIRELEEDFDVAARPAGAAIEVALTPRRERWREVMRRIELRFSGPDLAVEEIRMEDSLGDRLRIKLRDLRRNADLPDSLFEPG